MWIVEANVFVFSSVRRSIVGDVEDEIEMIWIGSDVCGVSLSFREAMKLVWKKGK